MSRGRIVLAGAAVLLVGAAAALGFALGRDGGETTPDSILPAAPLEISVDASLAPMRDSVPGLEDGDPPRDVGRVTYEDGGASDLVLGELIVATSSMEQLEGFLARHQGEVVDTFAGEDGEPDEHLVRVTLVPADPADVAEALTTVEEGHSGAYSVSDPMLLTMLHIAATEKRDHGIDVTLNWLPSLDGIVEAVVEEAPDRSNPFEWSYLMIGGQVDTGVVGAWQLMVHHGKVGNKVEVAIADGGFFENPDFPEDRKIRLDSWNAANPGHCTGGSACPTHGTDVALAALAQIDNGYGTAGVAGQVGSLIAIQIDGDFWTKLRRIKRVVDEERPAVVNMSFGMEVKLFRAASESSTDRHLKAMWDDGAVVFASAGNEGKNVDQEVCVGSHCYESRLTIPCESRYAICVGGYDPGTGWLHSGSNYGPKGGGRSVQIYAPFCVVTPFNPVNSGITDTKWTCGTSFSAPFVAGAAALVKAADPSLGPEEVWEVLRRTAHVGGLHFDHHIPTENQIRVNVLDAVLDALGAEITAPVVTITGPDDGSEYGISDFFELEGTAVDFKGQPLEISWESSVEGPIGSGFGSMAIFEPAAGTHTITAIATDVYGQTASASINVEVVDEPPQVSVSWPGNGGIFYETEGVDLVGLSLDPDTGPLRDGDVWWEVLDGGDVLFGTSGHVAEVPGGTLDPGKYEVVFSGSDGNSVGQASVEITVVKVIGSVPTATITTQFQDGPYGYGGGSGVPFTLTGIGTDPEDGGLSGTRFRWMAVADNGYEEVLCRGSNFVEATEPPEFNPGLVIIPPPGPTIPPVIVIPVDCKSVDVDLGLAPGTIGQTRWAIVLEVSDSDGQVGRDVADVLVVFAAP